MHEVRRSVTSDPMRGIELDDARAAIARTVKLDVEQGDGLAPSWAGEHVLMNPPFALAKEFVEKAITEAETAIVLLRLAYLGSKRRAIFWQAHPPSGLVVLAPRPSFMGGKTDSADYGWFVWGVEDFGLRWAIR